MGRPLKRTGNQKVGIAPNRLRKLYEIGKAKNWTLVTTATMRLTLEGIDPHNNDMSRFVFMGDVDSVDSLNEWEYWSEGARIRPMHFIDDQGERHDLPTRGA